MPTTWPLVGSGILDEDRLSEFQGGKGSRPVIVLAFGFGLNFGVSLCDVLVGVRIQGLEGGMGEGMFERICHPKST